MIEMDEIEGKDKSKKETEVNLDQNVEVIKGLLKWIRAQDIVWDSDLDSIFQPEFKAEEVEFIKRKV